jgi:AbrB family looped-hinge helix DNA binding protein
VEGAQLEVLGVSRLHANKLWLPKEVRQRLGLEEGDRAYFYVNEAGEVVIAKSERGFKVK